MAAEVAAGALGEQQIRFSHGGVSGILVPDPGELERESAPPFGVFSTRLFLREKDIPGLTDRHDCASVVWLGPKRASRI